jgi:HEAT repeat protein
LVAGLSDSSPKVRERAAYGFGLVGPPAASGVRELCRALSDPVKDVRQWAAWSIGHLGPAADYAVEDLQAALIDPSDDVREFAAQSLGKLGPAAHQAIDDLIPLLSDPRLYVAEKTAKSLGAFGPAAARALPALVETLQKHENHTTRSAAARALGAIGKRTPVVRKALLKALGDKRARVRWAAGDALLKVGRPEDVAEARRVIRRAPDEAMRQDAKDMRRFNRSLGF